MATYTIKSGDTLNKMAVVYKTTYTISSGSGGFRTNRSGWAA